MAQHRIPMKRSPTALSVEINQIPQEQVLKIWPFVYLYIFRACSRSPGIDPLDLYRRCQKGTAQLWATQFSIGNSPKLFCGAGATKLSRTPDDKLVCTIITYGSDPRVGFKYWTHIIDEVEKWARLELCDRMEIYGRKGWIKRLTDYRIIETLPEGRVILQKELN